MVSKAAKRASTPQPTESTTESRAKAGTGMDFGQGSSGLFATSGSDPRQYVGPPVPRRCRTPANMTSSSSHRGSQSPSALRPGNNSQGNNSKNKSGGQRKGGGRSNTPNNQSQAGSTTRVAAGRRQDGMMVGAAGGTKSLLTLDPTTKFSPLDGDILLDTPRSVAACQLLGITPKDLLVTTYQELLTQMKVQGEDTADSKIVKMRYEYVEKKRRRFMKAALEQRDQQITGEVVRAALDAKEDEEASYEQIEQKKEENFSTMVANEERRLQKIVDTNMSRLRQQLLHRELLQRQREKEDQRLAQSRREAEQRKLDESKYLAEKSRKEEEAQALRNEARELERAKHAAEVELKRAKYEEKDLQVKERLRKKQLMKEAMNEAKQEHNLERRRQMKEQGERVLEQRRGEFEVRWVQFEDGRREYKEKLREKQLERRSDAERKQEKIEAAIERCNEILQTKINRTNEREAAAQAKLHAFKKQREDEAVAIHEEEEAKQKMRQRVYAESQLQQQEKAVKFTERIRQAEARLKQNAIEEVERMREKHEEDRQRELEKKTNVQRSRKIDESRREVLDVSIQTKMVKIEEDAKQKHILAEKRRLHREEVERGRVHIPESTPGPGDYLVTTGNVGTEGARWKFGLPASVMSLRTISRNSPAPGYEASPGPGVYKADSKMYARHPNAPSANFGRHERWKEPINAELTPGPADYAPVTEDPLLDAHRAKHGNSNMTMNSSGVLTPAASSPKKSQKH